jgi:hypothetical protein
MRRGRHGDPDDDVGEGGPEVSDEQRVRTMAGWIGVEISKSRVRTPGKAGYGLYRARGQRNTAGGWVMSEWTPYVMGLGAIESAVEASIRNGAPSGPGSFIAGGRVVPTRWTSAYQGRRDLGTCANGGKAWPFHAGPPTAVDFDVPVAVTPEFAAEVSALDALLGAGLVEMTHVEGCLCDDDRYTAACIRATMPARQRQREANAAFQAEHLQARKRGLALRYAAKRARLGGEGQPS